MSTRNAPRAVHSSGCHQVLWRWRTTATYATVHSSIVIAVKVYLIRKVAPKEMPRRKNDRALSWPCRVMGPAALAASPWTMARRSIAHSDAEIKSVPKSSARVSTCMIGNRHPPRHIISSRRGLCGRRGRRGGDGWRGRGRRR